MKTRRPQNCKFIKLSPVAHVDRLARGVGRLGGAHRKRRACLFRDPILPCQATGTYQGEPSGLLDIAMECAAVLECSRHNGVVGGGNGTRHREGVKLRMVVTASSVGDGNLPEVSMRDHQFFRGGQPLQVTGWTPGARRLCRAQPERSRGSQLNELRDFINSQEPRPLSGWATCVGHKSCSTSRMTTRQQPTTRTGPAPAAIDTVNPLFGYALV